jgi:hypothetical protein
MFRRCLNRFGVVLDLLIASRYTSARPLLNAIGEVPTYKKIEAIRCWRQGRTYPRFGRYLNIVRKIEKHFEVRKGLLTELVRGTSSSLFDDVKNSQPQNFQLVREHLPQDFDNRPAKEKREILDWVSANVLTGASEYGKYQSRATRQNIAIIFPSLSEQLCNGRSDGKPKRYRATKAPFPLRMEMEKFFAFKLAALPPKRLQRKGRWQRSTAMSQLKRYGLVLGVFAGVRDGEIQGLGIPLENLTLALFVFPELWERYLAWTEKRRGFFSVNELNILYEVKSHTRDPTGWLRQHPELASRLRPVPGIVTARDVKWAQTHWDDTCTRAYEYAAQRIDELHPVVRMHRDPFEPILPVLTAKSPLRVYKKIGDEILRRMPDVKTRPRSFASAVRKYLMFRLAIHLGVRQRNLREILLCRPGAESKNVRELERCRRGELRWNAKRHSWEAFIPAVAIKNGSSAFFRWRPYHMILPDRENLYLWIKRYLDTHRAVLLNGRPDPGTFFVRTMWGPYRNAEFDIHSFYEQWKLMIQRYGIYNPYTKRGAIAGLRPHGPHGVRDILATHLLKTTGSYELASFAIQDSLESVMRHYARFLPHEKVARAADELNKVWRH